jgi:hypothetical protein
MQTSVKMHQKNIPTVSQHLAALPPGAGRGRVAAGCSRFAAEDERGDPALSVFGSAMTVLPDAIFPTSSAFFSCAQPLACCAIRRSGWDVALTGVRDPIFRPDIFPCVDCVVCKKPEKSGNPDLSSSVPRVPRFVALTEGDKVRSRFPVKAFFLARKFPFQLQNDSRSKNPSWADPHYLPDTIRTTQPTAHFPRPSPAATVAVSSSAALPSPGPEGPLGGWGCSYGHDN